MKPQFLIAGTSSNSGKTTFTLGLIKLLSDKGLKVQSFKTGPDYLDTQIHAFASSFPAVNLDSYMMSEAHIQMLFNKYSQNKDAVIIEGAMGLFDGAYKGKGSCAEIAAMLKIPVILVLNAKGMAYSAAPMLKGFMEFHPDVFIAGVVFNFVKSSNHYQLLKEASEDVGIKPLGYLAENNNLRIPSRHLGLQVASHIDYESIVKTASQEISKTVDVDSLREMTTRTETEICNSVSNDKKSGKKRLKIAVAKDDSFSFIYLENLARLQEIGDVSFFSPLKDKYLPDTDFIYLPGGYPELFTKNLSVNQEMILQLRNYCESGGKLLAECGGMMYLGKHILDQEGTSHEMVGFLDIYTTMIPSKLLLGYREFIKGTLKIRGHEFHYSSLIEINSLTSVGTFETARKEIAPVKMYKKKNVYASYTHFYWGEQVDFIEKIISNEL